MTDHKDTVVVNANVEISVVALKAIVENAKKSVGRDSKGYYRVDTAEKVSLVISRFLAENDFESFAKDINNCV